MAMVHLVVFAVIYAAVKVFLPVTPLSAQLINDNEISIDDNLYYPEGVLLHQNNLIYVDMIDGSIKFYDKYSKSVIRHFMISNCGPTSISPLNQNNFALTCHLSNSILEFALNGPDVSIVNIHNITAAGERIISPNDSHSDGDGGIFFSESGAFDLAAPSTGKITHMDKNKRIVRLVDGIRYANGVYYNNITRELYFSEHLEKRVIKLELSENYTVKYRTVFFDLKILPHPKENNYDKRGPDGIDIDACGNILIAEYGGKRLISVDKSGNLLRIIDVSQKFVTSMATDTANRTTYIVGTRDLDSVPLKGKATRLTESSHGCN